MSIVERLKRWQSLAVAVAAGAPVVFHHIPKCGGTSVGRALRLRYIVSQETVHPIHSFSAVEQFHPGASKEELFAAMRDFRQQMLLYLLSERVRCVSAHVPFCPAAHAFASPEYKFVTILRDPVERFVSHYFHSLNRNDYSRIELPLETFLSTEQARKLGSVYSEYLSGLRGGSDFTTDEAVESAVANLPKFDVIGFLDTLPDFQKRLSAFLGVRLRIKHENAGKGGGGSYKDKISPELLDEITKLCDPDMRIYAEARRLAGRT